VLAGFNDLCTSDPEIAAQWHPKKNEGKTPDSVIAGSHRKFWWQCSEGHTWEATVVGRTKSGRGCPYCTNQMVLAGYNDLESKNPELAAQWHPTKNKIGPAQVTLRTNKSFWWICDEGHEFRSSAHNRAAGQGCPRCARSGYDATSPGFLYLLRKEQSGLQQFGVTNHPQKRLATHRRNGWEQLDVVGPADGYWILETETALGSFFKAKGLLLPRDYRDKFDGYSESWHSDELNFSTCAEMLEALRDWETKI